jgi:hypothetical protein
VPLELNISVWIKSFIVDKEVDDKFQTLENNVLVLKSCSLACDNETFGETNLKIEAEYTTEAFATTKTIIRYHNSEYSTKLYRLENLKSNNTGNVFMT